MWQLEEEGEVEDEYLVLLTSDGSSFPDLEGKSVSVLVCFIFF